MEQILLNNTLPNQEITFDVDTKFITLRLRTTNNGLYADLSIEEAKKTIEETVEEMVNAEEL